MDAFLLIFPSSLKRKLARNRRSHLVDNVLPHQLPVTQTQKAGRTGRLPICHHLTICNVQSVSLGDQQGFVGSEDKISSSKQAAVSVIACYNVRDVIRQRMLFTLYPEVSHTFCK